MYFKDLEPYHYGVPKPLEDVVAVGWLSLNNSFLRGDTSPEFIHTLEQMLSTHRVNQARGYHVCEFCSGSPLEHRTLSGRTIILGSAEIWIPSLEFEVVYAAPDLIYHYVTEHNYLPPSDFIQAALHACDNFEWDPNSECDKRLQESFRSR